MLIKQHFEYSSHKIEILMVTDIFRIIKVNTEPLYIYNDNEVFLLAKYVYCRCNLIELMQN